MSISEYIARQFANPHGLGGRMITAIMNRQNVEMYRVTESLLAPRPHDVILDIGCGNGIMLNKLGREGDRRLIGVDISKDALASAKHRLADRSVELYCCPVDDMPLESATIDKAFTINTVYFWDDLVKGFNEIARVLKPEGIFISTHYANQALEAYPHTRYGYKKHPEEEIISVAQSVGFKTKTQSFMDGRAYCLVCRKR